MKLAISFTNFGPYHLARLRALARSLALRGGSLLAYETAGTEQRYPWLTSRRAEPFAWETLFPGRSLESLSATACARALRAALERDRPDAVAIVGYARPESMAALDWATRLGTPTVLMSESQAIDHPRVWWKEAVKRLRVRRFSAALVGGPRHRDYLVDLGMPANRIALGYDAVDHDHYSRLATEARRPSASRAGLPDRPYFLAVSRFVPEKNLPALVRAFASYRATNPVADAWDLVLCGDGPAAGEVESAVADCGAAGAVHRPGFLQDDELPRWYASASAFVHPSLMEPWGLVANEAAACGVPLLISELAGCVETLVPDPPGTTGWRFDPTRESTIAAALGRMAALPAEQRAELGRRASEIVALWGPERFARGTLEALDMAAAAVPANRHRTSRRAPVAARPNATV